MELQLKTEQTQHFFYQRKNTKKENFTMHDLDNKTEFYLLVS